MTQVMNPAWWRIALASTALAVAAAATAGTALRPDPSTAAPTPAALAATPTGPAAETVTGHPTDLPWPHTGQAALGVAGVAPIGGTGGPPVPVASLAKVMTAYRVLLDHPLRPGADGPTIAVTDAEVAAHTAEAARGESLIPLHTGELLTERQALIALLLPSANNVARILARWDAGTVDAFVHAMNVTAHALGMTATHYTDPSGFDPATVSTADDQLILAAQAMTVPALAEIVALRTATIPVAGVVTNVNRLLGTAGVVGIKTGSMTAAGGCLLFAARTRVAGRPVTVVGAVLGQPYSDRGALATAYDATRALLDAAGRMLRGWTLVRAGEVVATVAGGTLVASADATVPGWAGLTWHRALAVAVDATTVDGTRVGTVTWTAAGGPPVTVEVTLRRAG